MRTLILNSAHSKYPMGNDHWIVSTIRVLKKLDNEKHSILCGSSPLQWAFAAWFSGKEGFRTEFIIDTEENDYSSAQYKDLLYDLELSSTRTTPVYSGLSAYDGKLQWQLRDRFAIETADIICPVSIRPGGRLEKLLSLENAMNKVSMEFRTNWKKPQSGIVRPYIGEDVDPFPKGDWLFHWTRSSQGKWPGERTADFFNDMLLRPGEYVRSGLDTLIRILTSKLLISSSWRMPQKAQMVSFTSLSPEKAVELMKWRMRYSRYTFEPFGLAIRKEMISDYGGREVKYTGKTGVDDRKFTQSPGEKGNWTAEQEWRVEGDIKLDCIHQQDIIAIVPDKISSEKLNRYHNNIHILFK